MFKKIIFTFVGLMFIPSTLFAASVSDVTCKAFSQDFSTNPAVDIRQDLKKSLNKGEEGILEVEFNKHYFSVNLNVGQEGSHLMTITKAPDYTVGIISRSGFDSQGKMNLSLVEGSIVNKINCVLK